MARLPYKSTEAINDMNTRQLRQYISDKATEAQGRLDTVKIERTSKAFKQALQDIQGRGGKVKRSTSNMSKSEMLDYANALREFNALDVYSGYARNNEYLQNRKRYESFVENMLKDPLLKKYWSQFYDPETGAIDKKGYKKYKQYIQYLKSFDDIKERYGYETLKEYGIEARKDTVRGKAMERILMQTYEKYKDQGLDQTKLNEKFEEAMADWDRKRAARKKKASEPKLPKTVKPKKSKKPSEPKLPKTVKPKKSKKAPASGNKIKTKQGRKMKTSETVRERLT